MVQLKAPTDHLLLCATVCFQGLLAKDTSKSPVCLRYSMFPRCFSLKHRQTTCLSALQHVSKVFQLKAPADHLFVCTTACFQGVSAKHTNKSPVCPRYCMSPVCFGSKHQQTTCLCALQHVSKVFQLETPTDHLSVFTTACFQGVSARHTNKSPVGLHYSMFPMCFSLKAPTNRLFGLATTWFQSVSAKDTNK